MLKLLKAWLLQYSKTCSMPPVAQLSQQRCDRRFTEIQSAMCDSSTARFEGARYAKVTLGRACTCSK